MSMKIKKMGDLIPPKFHSVWKATFDPSIQHIVCKGGRGSGKSSDIAIIITQLLMRWDVNAVGIRATDNTLEQSIYEQMKWAIEMQGVTHLFKFNKSPLKITYLPKGNYMIFRGASDPERIKSLKDSKFPFAICWFEELAEFKSEDTVSTIVNSILRSELTLPAQYKFFYSYNPPKRKQNWVNKKYEPTNQPANTFVHKSTYMDNPFVAKELHEEAMNTKEKNELKYRWEYLGEAIGSGVVPFDNLEVKNGAITKEMIDAFDNYRCGLDFGYATDPCAFVVWHYDKKKRTIYAVDEIYKVKMSNRELAERIKAKGWANQVIYCDSAEPKSIAELQSYGLKARKAKKGKDSVEFGERWLDDLDSIVIDPKRTPNIANEFENIDYAVDRYGEVLPRLADKDNHAIDATRYSLNVDMFNSNSNFVSIKGGL